MTIAYFFYLSVTDGHFQPRERFEAGSRLVCSTGFSCIEKERF